MKREHKVKEAAKNYSQGKYAAQKTQWDFIEGANWESRQSQILIDALMKYAKQGPPDILLGRQVAVDALRKYGVQV